jgi:hypothetical protein
VSSDISIGDVIRAWRALGASTDDERRAIARLLGFDLREPKATRPPEPPAPRPPPPAPARPRTPVPETPHAPVTPSAEQGEPIELVPFMDAHDNPAMLPAQALARPTAARAQPVESLFTPGWSRAIATTLAARPARVGALDVGRAVEHIVRRQPIPVLPRLERLVSATEIAVVIDQRGTIAWFRDDAGQLIDRINAVTRAPVTVVTSDGAPALATTTSTADQDARDDDETPPASVRIGACGRVIGITDLGLGSCWSPGDPTRARAWIDLAQAVRARGASLAIVTPVPLDRIPAQLRRLAACVHWDGVTRPGLVRRLVKGIG